MLENDEQRYKELRKGILDPFGRHLNQEEMHFLVGFIDSLIVEIRYCEEHHCDKTSDLFLDSIERKYDEGKALPRKERGD